MLDLFSEMLVSKPLTILAIALLFLAGGLLLRSRLGRGPRSRALLLAAGGWFGYALWEWLVLVQTPEANIRVDLLLIWPVLAFLSLWAAYRVARR